MRSGALRAAIVSLGASLAFAWAPHAYAVDASCSQPQEIDKYQLLRRLSLDLRGFPPRVSEYQQLDTLSPTDIAKTWTTHWDPDSDTPSDSQEAFRQQMRKYHQQLFWPNVTNVTIHQFGSSLQTDRASGVLYLAGRAGTYYSQNADFAVKPDLSTINSGVAPCDTTRPQPSNAYYPDGFHRPIPQNDTYSDGGSYQWVGYRDIQPYWLSDGGTVRVCAFEAQETDVGGYYKLPDGGRIAFSGAAPDGGGVVGPCADGTGTGSPACGCGPNLRYCGGGSVSTEVKTDMAESMLRIVDQSTVGGHPYADLLQTTTSYVNGHLAFYEKYQANLHSSLGGIFTRDDTVEHAVPVGSFNSSDPGAIPDLGYSDGRWFKVTRSPEHAGVLTHPAYLLRFQTNRSRANRFRIDFLCNYFVPPDQLTDAPPACNAGTSDLMRKCNCRLCHATLEPLAAHWGAFSESGVTLLQADAGFPLSDPKCAPYPDGGQRTTDGRCTRYYVVNGDFDVPPGEVDANAHKYGGTLKTYLYNDIHQNVLADNIMQGKDALRREYIDNAGHDLAHCTVKKVFAYFMRRDMRLVGADNDEAALLETLAQSFVDSNYDFAKLVTDIVSLPQYRRVR